VTTTLVGKSAGIVLPESAAPLTGGLVFRFLRHAGVNDADLRRLKLADVLILPLIAWLPLFVLTAIAGTLMPGSITAPFALDLSTHIRLLGALPLLLLGGLVSEVRVLPTIAQFVERRLIPEGSMERFQRDVDSAFRLGDSVIADLLLIAIIYAVDATVLRSQFAQNATSWKSGSAAGAYDLYVSLPIFQFVLLRWYYRLFVWARFLVRVSRLRLQLLPTHPDRMGGLGFLITGVQTLTIFAMAHGVLLAGWLSARVIVRGTPIQTLKAEIVAMPIFVICLCLAPLLVFTRSLVRAKRQGIADYGALASAYARDFAEKWVRGSDSGEVLVGSADIQSLADMGGSYDIVQSMRNVAITPQIIIAFAIVTLLPVAPLLLTAMPLSEILKRLAGILF